MNIDERTLHVMYVDQWRSRFQYFIDDVVWNGYANQIELFGSLCQTVCMARNGAKKLTGDETTDRAAKQNGRKIAAIKNSN